MSMRIAVVGVVVTAVAVAALVYTQNAAPRIVRPATIDAGERWTDLVGQRRQVVVESERIIGNVSFWVGTPPNDMLVVIHRDRRSGFDRMHGRPSANPFAGVPGTLLATIGAVVEPLPRPEAMYSWGLTRRDIDRLEDRGVYLAAYDLLSTTPAMPIVPAAELIDEWGRETAPPPGDEVETPLNLPPPLP